MPKVPLYEQQISTRTPSVPAPVRLPTVEGAFGGDIAKADQNLAEQVQRSVNKLHDHWLGLQERKDEKAVLEKATQFRQAQQDILDDPGTAADQVPPGLMNRQLGHAEGISTEYDNKMVELRDSFLQNKDQPLAPNQSDSLGKIIDSYILANRDNVFRHESSEATRDHAQAFDSYLKLAISDAGDIRNVVELDRFMESADEELVRNQKHLGYFPDAQGNENPATTLQRANLKGQMVRNAVMSLLDEDPAKGAKLFNSFSDQLPVGYRTEITNAIDGKLFFIQKQSIFDSVAKFRRKDGTPDVSRMEEAVRKMGLPADRVDKVVNYVQERAAEMRTDLIRDRMAKDREFENTVLAHKNGGGKLDGARALVTRFAVDPKDAAQKTAWLTDLYAGPKARKSVAAMDPRVYMEYWEKAKSGDLTRDEINDAFEKKILGAAEVKKFGQMISNAEISEQKEEEKAVWNSIKVLAKDKISNREQQDGFLRMMTELTDGKPIGEWEKIAADQFKKYDSGTWKPAIFEKARWKVNLERKKDPDKAMLDMAQILGTEQLESIGRAVGKKGWSALDVEKFAEPYGGLKGMRTGTPVNNAIKSLRKYGRAVNHDTIKWVLDRSADGNM